MAKSKHYLPIHERKMIMGIVVEFFISRWGLPYEKFIKAIGYMSNKMRTKEGRKYYERAKNSKLY